MIIIIIIIVIIIIIIITGEDRGSAGASRHRHCINLC